MSDDTPTERFQPPPDGTAHPPGPPSHETDGRSRKLLIWLVVLGGLILVALIIVLTLLFSRGTGSDPVASPIASAAATPTATATPASSAIPSSTASESPSESPSSSPDATGMRFTSFDTSQEMRCSAGGTDFPATIPNLLVSWTTEGAEEAWYVNGTSDAADSGYMQVPLNGSQADFPYDQPVGCATGEHTFTMTLVGPDGTHLSKTTTVTATGDRF